MLNATKLGEKVGLKPQRVNAILSELGWLARAMKGWVATDNGKSHGARQRKDSRSGVPYVVWPSALAENKFFRDAAGELGGDVGKSAGAMDSTGSAHEDQVNDIRKKYPADIRTADGHYVRSRAEAMIDEYLYRDARVVHAYERKVPVEGGMLCDFYIPAGEGHGAVYIEFWGLENDPKYRAHKEKKQAAYKKHGLDLINIGDTELNNLGDYLSEELRKRGIKVAD